SPSVAPPTTRNKRIWIRPSRSSMEVTPGVKGWDEVRMPELMPWPPEVRGKNPDRPFPATGGAAKLYVARGLLLVGNPSLFPDPYAKAALDFTEAIRLDPQPPYRIYRAYARYEAMGSHLTYHALKEVEKDVDQAIGESPKFAEAYAFKGLISWRRARGM